jgi:translation initiation factor 2A
VEFRTSPFSEFTPTTGAGLRNEAGAEGQILYSHDGSVLALVSPKDVKLLDTSRNNAQISLLPRARIEHLWFSPGHSYLATWDRKTNENKAQENLIVWNVRTGAEMFKVHCQDLDPTAQRPVQWTFDEVLLAYIVTNEVKFYPAAAPNLAQPSSRLHIQTIAQFALAPEHPAVAGAAPAAAASSSASASRQQYHVAAFLPSRGTEPARVGIYSVPLSSGSPAETAGPTASKSFFKAEEVSLKWSPTGHAILIETRTATDKTGKSYYGESGLHLLLADGSYQGTVPFGTNAGPIQDVAWSPTAKEFMVIQGFQPAVSEE